MSLRFCNLGSGSSGNASYVEADGFGVLLDVGLGPRRLTRGLTGAGVAWEQVRAAVLTHAHGDHWSDKTLKLLLTRRITLYCHRAQRPTLRRLSFFFPLLEKAGLVADFEAEAIELGPCRWLPFEVSHDDEPTSGFRVESPAGSLGYAADLGTWTEAIAGHLCNVDILAVEFNHDVAMQRSSGRPAMLIDRVLGDRGHLSNEQAARLVTRVMSDSEPGCTKHLVLLHLSQQCNDPRLARAAAAQAIARHGTVIHVARPNSAGPMLTGRRRVVQAMLPGWE